MIPWHRHRNMFANFLRRIRNFQKKYRGPLPLILAEGLPRYATAILYALLAVLIAEHSNEAVAGMAFSLFALFELLITDPLGGALADRFGARSTLYIHAIISCLTGIILFLFPQTLGTALLVGFALFTCFGLRTIGVYLLRITNRNEGGFVFGLSESVISLAYFLSTMSIPFFSHSGRTSWVAIILMLASVAYFIVIMRLPDDRKNKLPLGKRKGYAFNPIDTIKHGLHFVRVNHHIPIMPLAAYFFEGIFYSTIWFVFPLRFSKLETSGFAGLELGIYDLVTIFFAGVCGYLADRYNWKIVNTIGWFFVLIGVTLLPAASVSVSLILAGLVIAVGNNLSYFSAEHALTKYDIDHREDGSFMALMTMLRSLGYVVSPMIAGFLYHRFNFSVALIYACILSGAIALFMMWRTWNFRIVVQKSAIATK